MSTAGFTFIRNAIKYDYPIVEAIRSVLPLCEIFVVAVGKSEDETLELVRSINDPRLKILETIWDDSLREGGRVLAAETQKAFDAIPKGHDWAFYIQGDECVHEQDLPNIQQGLEEWRGDRRTEGFVFNYQHFYGSYDYLGASRKWYRREVRVVRPHSDIRSYRDAQGFRWKNGQKLRVRPLNARIFHYGWVKSPAAQQQKQLSFNRLWHSDEEVTRLVKPENELFQYRDSEPLERFTGSHPAVMQTRISAVNWHFDNEPSLAQWSWKDRISRFVEQNTGWRPGEYKNFRWV